MAGTMTGVTREPRHAAAMRSVIGRAGAPAFAVDGDRRIVAWNVEATRLTGYRAAEVIGRPCHEVVQGLDAQGNIFCRPDCNVVWACRRGRPVFPFRVSIRSAGGVRGEAVLSLVAVPARTGPILIHLLSIQDPPDRAAAGARLTARERQILKLLAGGAVVKQVAAALSLSVATVRAHVRNSLRKLGSHSQGEAIAKAFRKGLF